MIYRRRIKSDTWHFMAMCKHWPVAQIAGEYVEQYKKPRTGELCNQCRAKQRKMK